VAIYGLLGGAKVPAIAYLASRHFGARAFGTLYGATNTAIALGVGVQTTVAGLGVTVLDAIGLGAVALMLGGLLWRAARNLRVLAEREPYAA
jgi:hypothetical protein